MATKLDLPTIYQRFEALPLGRAAVSSGYRFVAPYFLSIPARLDALEPGTAVATMAPRPWTRNHLGTVHAIAQCNLAEFVMGALAEATVPPSHRWIPRGMSVDYLAPAKGRLRATATLTLPPELPEKSEVAVQIAIVGAGGDTVARAEIRLWVTARNDRGA